MNRHHPSKWVNFRSAGTASLPDYNNADAVNELVWSSILLVPNQSTFAADKKAIQNAIQSLQRHYNSHTELIDARRHLDQSEVKAAVRAAASAVEACLLHLCQRLGVQKPKEKKPFNQTVESVLRLTGRPSYSAVEPQHLKQLLYLYRARNSMHEGDCYFKADDGKVIFIRDVVQAKPLVDSAEAFVLWADATV